MEIFNNFKNWANNRFKGDIIIQGSEVRINSIFVEDSKHHLWCSPKGGKSGIENGVYHCFKTDKKGSLVKLIRLVDKCSTEEAYEILKGKKTIRQLEKELLEFFEDQDKNEKNEEDKIIEKTPNLKIPEGCFLISYLYKNNFWRKLAEEYLGKRKISIDGLFICTQKPYKARVLIPYYSKENKLIYWNTRHIGSSSLRYLGPPKTCGVGKEDVLYFPHGIYPKENENLYLCEGEFDALTLHSIGLNSVAAGGKNFNLKQANILKNYKITICLDNDRAGIEGGCNMFKVLSSNISNKNIRYVTPHKNYKDYNDMYIAEGENILKSYIIGTSKPFDLNSSSGIIEDYLKIKML